MAGIRNVLFIMCDQLRADYLSCYGHPVLHTPHLDSLARRGVLFTRAFVQSAICGPSRMSFYTGRYVTSHRATWNFVPLPMDEWTLGDHLRAAGRRAHLAGKTHVEPERAGMRLRGIEDDAEAGALLREGGFDVVERHEGDLPAGKSAYQAYLRNEGYAGEDPWLEYAVGVLDASGTPASGWSMRNAHLPARVKEKHSETAFLTDVALDFIRGKGEAPWVLHLSYIKPHWPYVAPAPYHAMYRAADTGPIVRSPREQHDEHPVAAAFRRRRACEVFSREECVRHVRPAYMGLVRQIDDHLGRLFSELERLGRMRDTLIVFTSDHGDYLGDHGLGEKELFHDTVQRVPFILYDPDARADATRGSRDERLVEAIDTLPTVLEALALPPAAHRIEGRSLLALTRAPGERWRDCVFSELDYAPHGLRRRLGMGAGDTCRAWMVRTGEWKYVHWHGFRPQLFHLAEDPLEFEDLGGAPAYEGVRAGLRERLFDWLCERRQRTTRTWDEIEGLADGPPAGIHIGLW